jgi:predicted transposase/invertase (TIGR01784 family)
MKLNYHSHFYPSNDVVFSVLFAKKDLFCTLVSAVTGDAIELDGEPHSQATLREDDVLLNSIRFDTFAWSLDKKLYTADMQRSYKEARLERRTVYYACRAISTQEVKDMAYEELNPVNISFILTDHDEKQAIRKIKLCDLETYQVFDDLIELTLVHVPAALRLEDKKSNLYIFARFFDVSSQADADSFVKEFESTVLGKDLIDMYNNAVANANNLQRIENSPYFSGRLTEAQLEEERKKTEKKTLLRTARKMLSMGLSLDIITQSLGLDIDTINSLKSAN